MSTSAFFIAAGLLLGQVAASPDDLTRQVRDLVADFDAPQKVVRDAAEKKLINLGPAALNVLPKLDHQASAEARQRLVRVRNALEQLAASRSVEATTFTLQGQYRLSAVLKALREQTGNPLVDFRKQFGQQVQDAPVDCKFAQTPFWQALDSILDQTHLTIYSHAGEEGLGVVERLGTMRPRVGSASYSGAFRVAGVDLMARRDLRDEAGRSLQLTLEIAWEPRLKPVVFLQPLGKVTAVDEQSRPIAVAHPENQLEFNVQPGAQTIEASLQFSLPDRSSRKIARLDGELTVLVPGKAEEFRFQGLEKNERLDQRRGSVTVTVDRTARNNQLWQVFLRVTFDRGEGALESHRNWILNNEAWLENAQGEKIAYAGLETTRQSENEVGLAYLFGVDEGLAGLTFVYRTPANVARLAIPFQLKDLELP